MIKFLLASLLGVLLSGAKTPSEASLNGCWGCVDNIFVFMEDQGPTPSKSAIDAEVKAMGATRDNCQLTFTADHNLNFRVGKKSFDLKWTLDPATKEFKTTVGPVKMTGYLIEQGDNILLVYSKSDLLFIMKFLCSSDGRRHIAPASELLDCCEGLTLGMVFTKL